MRRDSPAFDVVVSGGTCVTPWGTVEADLGVRDGRIAALGSLGSCIAGERFDARGLHVLPGVIDTQVHFREPGLEHKETIASGTAAALLGGVTTVLDMPNTVPPTTTADALADKVGRVHGRAWTDIAFFVGATPENASTLGALEGLPGCSGVKLFMGSSTGSLLVDDEAALAEVMRHGRRRIAVHAEDEGRLVERRHFAAAPGAGVGVHPVWRDELSALLATERCLRVARRFGRRVHVLHVTTAEELEVLERHRDVATFEVTPQHLTLAAPDCYERLGTLAQMNPPIRDARHRTALWRALRAGLVDVVGSDHAPHTREEKARPYPTSPSGMPGVQTLLPVMLTHVHEGRLSLARLVDLVATGPARVYAMARKGRIAVGADADLACVDLTRRVRLTHAMMRSACGWTPFHGLEVVGFPVATLLRGRIAARDGDLVGAPEGRPVVFEETLAARLAGDPPRS
ncbi:MAG: dihydroorotase [Deltaproteobacteria bacterium]|nr:dihydroorotase [Deltaproteobacteria bacterium]